LIKSAIAKAKKLRDEESCDSDDDKKRKLQQVISEAQLKKNIAATEFEIEWLTKMNSHCKREVCDKGFTCSKASLCVK